MRSRAMLLAALLALLLPATASANYPHVVQPGETLTSVAALDGLSIEAIANANGISPQAQLIAGATLWIPPRTAESSVLGTTAATATTATTAATAATAKTAVTASSDPDSDGDVDSTAGTRTRTSATTAVQTASSTQSTQASPSTPAAGSGAPLPTPERVSAGQIATVADANGVPAALAEAIAWQESGWNNAMVSGVGAVGVMQIVPATWNWIDRYLTPSAPLGTASALENIRAGVLLLHQLLQLTGGDEQLAVAGYFQGLRSVQIHGMYAQTRQYVADVMALAQRMG